MAVDEDAGYLAELVRSGDRPRYYATLFAPADKRADLLALYGFAVEIARVPDLVREPPLGEIRLQWWRDSLEAAFAPGGEGATPVLRALAATIRRRALPAAPLLALIDAHRADLYSDSPATVTDLEGYFGETESALFQLAALVLGASGPETADGAGHAGIAYGLTRRLARFVRDRAAAQSIVPVELGGAADPLADNPAGPPVTGSSLAALSELAGDHLKRAEAKLTAIRASLLPAFLPLATTGALLRRCEALGPALLERPAELSDLQSLVRIGWTRMRGFAAPRGGRLS